MPVEIFYHGFCYLNSAAIAANAFVENGHEVSIIDFDAHHGDGTQDIVKDIPMCKYISLHADPSKIMPHSGYEHDHGYNNNIFNRPFEIGISEEQYLDKLKKVIIESETSGSDFLIISAGFDAHKDEFVGLPPLTYLTDNGYREIGSLIKQLNLPTLVILEGGYNQEVTPKAFSSFINGLTENNRTELFTGEDTLLEGEQYDKRI